MTIRWQRKGNFFQHQDFGDRNHHGAKLLNAVILQNVTRNDSLKHPVIVRAVEVYRHAAFGLLPEYLRIKFHFADSFDDEFLKQFDDERVKRKTPYAYKPMFKCNEARVKIDKHNVNRVLTKLISALNNFNQHYKQKAFSVEIITELTKIISAFRDNELDNSQHSISETEPTIQSSLNSAREHSNELIELVKSELEKPNERSFPVDQFRSLLVKGENPNQKDMHGMNVLCCMLCLNLDENGCYMVTEEQLLLIKWLLLYGADQYDVSTGADCISAKEQAKYWLNFGCSTFKILIDIFDAFEKLDSRTKDSIKIQHANIAADRGLVTSHFIYENNQIVSTEIRAMNSLTQGERRNIFEVYSEAFPNEVNNKKNLEDMFEDIFNGNNKIIEIIKVAGKIVGFVVFEILKQQDNTITIHLSLAGMKNEYRRLNIMKLLLLRLPFSIAAHLTPHLNIGIFVLVLSPIIYMQFFDQIHSPKYFPENEARKEMKDRIEDCLLQIYGTMMQYYHSVRCCYLIENDSIHIKEPVIDNLIVELYNAFRGNIRKAVVPMYFNADKEGFDRLNKYTEKLGISAEGQINALALALRISGLLNHLVGHVAPRNQDKLQLPRNRFFSSAADKRILVDFENTQNKGSNTHFIRSKL